jgi:hypothetical protein
VGIDITPRGRRVERDSVRGDTDDGAISPVEVGNVPGVLAVNLGERVREVGDFVDQRAWDAPERVQEYSVEYDG